MKFVRRNQIVAKKNTYSNFANNRNTLLFIRGSGGLGDILMHRMIFEDVKLQMPDAEIVFACPKVYHEAVIDHPYIDKVIDSDELNILDYKVFGNTTTICAVTESYNAPNTSPHRSDIWANHCKINLTRHNMHIRISEEEKNNAKAILEEHGCEQGKTVIIAPISSMLVKNLREETIVEIYEQILAMGYTPILMHNKQILSNPNIKQVFSGGLRRWMSLIDQCDYMISVDTSMLHCAGGMGKPTLGIFTFANGEVYTKYYPKAEVLQGGCPFGHKGCFVWTSCPKVENRVKIPCCDNINSFSIMESFKRLVERFPS